MILRNTFSRKNSLFLLAGLLSMTTVEVAAQQAEKSAKAGTGIYEAAINSKDGLIYVTGAGSRTNPAGALFKINPADLSLVDSISLKDNPPFGLAINNKTQVAYTTNTRTNSVSAVDLKTGKILATITNGAENSHTREVLVDEAANLIYISDVGDPSTIWVIDGKTNRYLHSITGLGKTVTGIAFGNGRDKIYATVMSDNAIAVVNTKTKTVEKTFSSGGEAPVNIVSDGKRLFVTNQKSGTLTVLDLKGTLLKSISTGAGAIGIAYDPVKNRLYSANRGTGTTTVIDAKTYEVLADVETGSAPNNVKVDAKGVAYVINKTKGGRPQPGETPQVDSNGDTVTKIK